MGRIASHQVAGLDFIDKLYFTQLFVYCTMSQAERNILWTIITRIDKEVEKLHLPVVEAAIFRNAIFSMLEVAISNDLTDLGKSFHVDVKPVPEDIAKVVPKLQEHKRNYLIAMTMATIEKTKQVDLSPTLNIVEKLATEFSSVPAVVRYDLFERCFALQYPNGPVACFAWLCKMRVLNITKTRPERLPDEFQTEFLLHLVMICEFQDICTHVNRTINSGNIPAVMLDAAEKFKHSAATRDKLFELEIKLRKVMVTPQLKNSFSFLPLKDLNSEESLQHFFSQIGNQRGRFRISNGTIASWVGTLGAAMVEIQSRFFGRNKPIYVEICNEGSITDAVRLNLKDLGFVINARTLYERHRELRQRNLRIIKVYYDIQQKEDVAIPPEYDDIFYFGLVPIMN